VERFALNTDPMANDPGRWGHSLANLAEIWGPVLDAARPRSVLEVGAYAGDVTRILLEWAARSGARVTAIDPDPQPPLEELAAGDARLELIRARSLEAIPALPAHDAVMIDGDHNYHTVSEELRLIAAWAPNGELPLILCHDACWPHGRRDAYYEIERIPERERQPTVELGHLFPGDPGIHAGGLLLYHHRVAQREGGPRNGVRTALEDFAAGRPGLALAVVPAFFGLAALWPTRAAWAGEVAALLAPWAGNPMLARLEANRVLHLASRELEHARAESERARAQHLEERWARSSALLSRLVQSRAFSVAVWLSRLRRGGVPEFSKEEIRQLLGR
jgi:SAM-dependent methyltransferase